MSHSLMLKFKHVLRNGHHPNLAIPHGVMAKYANSVSSASEGAEQEKHLVLFQSVLVYFGVNLIVRM